jgi:putative transposase
VGKKTGPSPTDRAKRGTKRSLLTEGGGIPLSVVVDGANRHDMKLLRPTLHQMPLCYPPLAQHSINVCLDKGYDFDEIRQYLSRAGFIAHVRSRGEEKKAIAQQPQHPTRRWVVERTHGWLNRYRRLLVRWEKKAQNYTAMLHFACGLITFRQTGLFG